MGIDIRYYNYGACEKSGLSRCVTFDTKEKILTQFDLSDLPSDITIISSVLKLTLESYYYNNEEDYKPVKPHRVLREWNEGDKNSSQATDGEVNWIYAKHKQVSWTTEGAGDIGTDIASQEDPDSVTDPVWDENAVHEVDLSNSTQTIIAGAVNNGWLLRNEIVNEFTIVYYSDDVATVDYRPKLIIEYDDNVYWKIGKVGWHGENKPFKWIFN